jgi:hypothetical protein
VVRVADVGTFFGDRQNTVFLHCSCPNFLPIWYKPDYGYNPHITLYDGTSRAFAEALCDVAEQYPLRYSFRVKELEPLVSIHNDPRSPIREQFESTILAELIGDRLTLEEIDSMDDTQRLECVARIARQLSLFTKVSLPA